MTMFPVLPVHCNHGVLWLAGYLYMADQGSTQSYGCVMFSSRRAGSPLQGHSLRHHYLNCRRTAVPSGVQNVFVNRVFRGI